MASKIGKGRCRDEGLSCRRIWTQVKQRKWCRRPDECLGHQGGKMPRMFAFTFILRRRTLLFSSCLWGDVSPPAALSYQLFLSTASIAPQINTNISNRKRSCKALKSCTTVTTGGKPSVNTEQFLQTQTLWQNMCSIHEFLFPEARDLKEFVWAYQQSLSLE